MESFWIGKACKTTAPDLVDAAPVLAEVLVLRTGFGLRAVVEGAVLIGPVHTVWVPIAHPPLGDAHGPSPLPVGRAVEFLFLIALPGVWGRKESTVRNYNVLDYP